MNRHLESNAVAWKLDLKADLQRVPVLSRMWSPQALPWLAGAGIAVGHVLTSSNCSIPKQGSCSACGSCVVALGSLTAWALIKQKTAKNKPFYEQ